MIPKSARQALSVALLALSAASLDARAACINCGVVVDTRTVTKQGEGSGLGAVAGGVIGGVLGHQVGSGRGNTAATVVGAGAGAYAGNEIEKNRKTTTSYQVVVKMNESGDKRTFNFTNPSSYRIGDKIRIVDQKLVRQK